MEKAGQDCVELNILEAIKDIKNYALPTEGSAGES
jgi:hypothetical protein